jgi:hypothetical protein
VALVVQMIKFENTSVFNFENAFRGMRNPLNSWDKSSSKYCLPNMCSQCLKCNCDNNDNIDWTPYQICDGDLDLAVRLIKGGTEHRKFLRQIFVSVDIIAPIYWFKQFDTYKIGTVANSTSTMHKIHSKQFSTDDFSYEDMSDSGYETLSNIIDALNMARNIYLDKKDKQYWFDMIKLLPECYNQKRTITMNYENILSICKQRKGHKLKEWEEFIKWSETLPYAKYLLQ